MLSPWLIPPLEPYREPITAWRSRHRLLDGLILAALTACGLTLWQTVFDRIVPDVNNGWAIYWPFNGILLAILLMCQRRYWPWLLAGFVASFAHNEITAHEPPGEIVTVILSNVTQILLAALLLPPFHTLKQWLLEPRLVTRFALYAVLLGPLLTSLPVALYFGHRFPGHTLENIIWWSFSDALGAALWTPFILVLISRETYDLFRWRALPQTVLLLSALGAITWAVFSQDLYPLGFIPYPLLLFIALRLGFSGAVIGVNLLTLIVTSRSVHNIGPFHLASQVWDTPHTVVLQVFATLAALFVFPLSITMIERKDFEQRLREAYIDMKQLATLDPLTGLANRRHFDQMLQQEWNRATRSAAPLGLLMIDADCFKAYNDNYGHVAGDECLRRIATLLSAESLRRHDLIARYGGEEFAVLLPGSDPQHLEDLAERLRNAVASAGIPHLGNPYQTVTLSVGCTWQVPTLNTSPEDLIDTADRALYEAKQSGRNRVCCRCETPPAPPIPVS